MFRLPRIIYVGFLTKTPEEKRAYAKPIRAYKLGVVTPRTYRGLYMNGGCRTNRKPERKGGFRHLANRKLCTRAFWEKPRENLPWAYSLRSQCNLGGGTPLGRLVSTVDRNRPVCREWRLSFLWLWFAVVRLVKSHRSGLWLSPQSLPWTSSTTVCHIWFTVGMVSGNTCVKSQNILGCF